MNVYKGGLGTGEYDFINGENPDAPEHPGWTVPVPVTILLSCFAFPISYSNPSAPCDTLYCHSWISVGYHYDGQRPGKPEQLQQVQKLTSRTNGRNTDMEVTGSIRMVGRILDQGQSSESQRSADNVIVDRCVRGPSSYYYNEFMDDADTVRSNDSMLPAL